MSGTAPAPQRIIPPLADQPLIDVSGRASYSMTQWMQRLSAFIGPVQPPTSVGGTSTTNVSLSEQVSNLSTIVNQLLSAPLSDNAFASRLAQLEQEIGAARALAGRPAQLPGPAFTPRPSGITYLANGARVLDGYGTPNSLVYGSVGDEYLQRDGSTAGTLWVKTSGANTNTGWTSASGEIYAPAVNGDLPGPSLISDPSGQCIMVPIT
jgi:hypothetical protein